MPSPEPTFGSLLTVTPGHGVQGVQGPSPSGRTGEGTRGAWRRRCQEARRQAVSQFVSNQGVRAVCAPSPAAMRKQTRGNSSVPGARSPRICARRWLGQHPPGNPRTPTPRGPAPPRLALPHLTPHARARSRNTHPAPPARPDRGLSLGSQVRGDALARGSWTCRLCQGTFCSPLSLGDTPRPCEAAPGCAGDLRGPPSCPTNLPVRAGRLRA